jgi:hypothetical protein
MGRYKKDSRELKVRAEEGAFCTFERAWELSPTRKTISHNWIRWGKVGRYLIQVIWMMGRPAQEMASVSSGSGRLYCEGEVVCKTERVAATAEGTGRRLHWSISTRTPLLVLLGPRMSASNRFRGRGEEVGV